MTSPAEPQLPLAGKPVQGQLAVYTARLAA